MDLGYCKYCIKYSNRWSTLTTNYVATTVFPLYTYPLIKNQTLLSKNLKSVKSLTSLCNFQYCFPLLSTSWSMYLGSRALRCRVHKPNNSDCLVSDVLYLVSDYSAFFLLFVSDSSTVCFCNVRFYLDIYLFVSDTPVSFSFVYAAPLQISNNPQSLICFLCLCYALLSRPNSAMLFLFSRTIFHLLGLAAGNKS